MQKPRQDHLHAIKLQKGKTGLMLAVEFHDDNEHKELVATLMEATKVAGALHMRDEDDLSGIIMASGLSCHTNRSDSSDTYAYLSVAHGQSKGIDWHGEEAVVARRGCRAPHRRFWILHDGHDKLDVGVRQ